MSSVIDVVALALQRKSDGKYLIARRGPADSGAGYWEFPGGKIDPGESQKQALVREIHEEFSLQLVEENLIAVGSLVHHYPSKSIRLHLWKAAVQETPQLVLHEHDQVAWCAPEEMQNYSMSAADIPFIGQLALNY